MSYQPQSKKQPSNLKPKRFIILGDLHFGVGANDEFFFRSMITYMREIFIPWVEQNIKEGDMILCTGDVFDNDTTIRIEVYDAVCAIFEKLATLAPVVTIVGNHDVVRKRTNEVNSLRGIGLIDGVYVYYQPTIWELAYGQKILLYPWKKEIETIEDFDLDDEEVQILFSHAHFNGLAFDNEFVKKVDGEIKSIDIKDLSMFKLVINGHIHRKQSVLNILNVGSPWQLTHNDDKNQVGFHVLDLKDYTVTWIENTFSPRFMSDTIGSILEWTTEEALDAVRNKLVRISYPAEMAKTFSLDIIRRELEGAITVEFQPEYKYNHDESSKMSEETPEIVDLKNIMDNMAHTLQVPETYADSLVDELHAMYIELSKIETTEL